MADTDVPGTSLRREIEVSSPPEAVWELLVDDDERSAWFGGPTALDAVPAGEGWFEESDGSRRTAVVEDVVPHRRLSWTWRPGSDGGEDAGDPSRVQIDLTPLPGGTRISVTETLLTASAQGSAVTARRGPLLDLELRAMLGSRPLAACPVR